MHGVLKICDFQNSRNERGRRLSNGRYGLGSYLIQYLFINFKDFRKVSLSYGRISQRYQRRYIDAVREPLAVAYTVCTLHQRGKASSAFRGNGAFVEMVDISKNLQGGIWRT